MSKFKYQIGDRVKFMPYTYDNEIIDGQIIDKKSNFLFCNKRYLVEYGMGMFGFKTSDAVRVRWVSESKIVRLGWEFPQEEVKVMV